MKNKSRKCPICNSIDRKILYNQSFAKHFSHHIACCRNCGFVYVSNAPGINYYSRYYENMSKYEDTRDQLLHQKSARMISSFARKKDTILDIGCATGHLLYLLKKNGFINLNGIDPAPLCKKFAKRSFALDIKTAELYSFKSPLKYDFIILSAILEHLTDLHLAVEHVVKLLKSNGKIFVGLPDAGSFHKDFDEPFGEFSVEHINFFNSLFLKKLLSSFKPLTVKSDKGVIYSVWQKVKDRYLSPVYDNSLKAAIVSYIGKSEKKLLRINQIIDGLPNDIIVWGAGSLTRRLLRQTGLGKKVKIYLDRDKNLQHRKLNGISILSPLALKKYSAPVLISSFRFKNEIRDFIRHQGLKNRIITF